MFIVLIRTAILYILVVFSMRIMGKRQIGELEPFELVIAIMISDLASLPMQDTRIPLLHGVIPILTLLILQVVFSLLQLKSEKIRAIIDGKPSVVVKKGKIQVSQLHEQRLSTGELLEELRINGYLNIEDIEYATLETNGKLSIIPKTELQPVTKKDLNIKTTQEVLPIVLISEGKVIQENLTLANKSEDWLMKELGKQKMHSVEQVFIAVLNSQNKLYCQPFQE